MAEMNTSDYEVVKGSRTHSLYVGKRGEGGRHITLKAGKILRLNPEQAKQLGNKVVKVSGDVRALTNDAPVGDLPDQYVPPVATRKVGEGAIPKRMTSAEEAAQGHSSVADDGTDYAEVVDVTNATDLKDLVDSMDEAGDVEALLAAENAREKPRSTVVAAAEAKLKTLKGQEG